MPYQLHDELSFCEAGGHFVFLDISADRYFRLSKEKETVLKELMRAGTDPSAYLHQSTGDPRYADVPASEFRIVYREMAKATRSIMEDTPSVLPVPRNALSSIACTVLITKWRLRRHPLKKILHSMSAYRDSRSKACQLPGSSQRFRQAALQFKQARLKVPVQTSCLLDSIALVRHLAKQELHSRLVFGVTIEPFCAHCWVQADDVVLNDTIGSVSAHVPIRVI